MVWIPAGTFRMGDIQGGGYSNEGPVHEVSVDSFAMGRYEVTFAEYDKFAQATGKTKPDDKGWGRGNRPVIEVSWDDAVAYAQWLSQQTGKQYRLPNEAEWEYAARAGTESKYWWSNDIGTNQANCYNSDCADSFDYTAPVGSFAPNPFGLYDMAGNVWEWSCSSYESRYDGQEQQCAATDQYRVVRGSGWNGAASYCRAAFRSFLSPDERGDAFGFRLLRIHE
jgi:formylglycine-generating enzyme required for sulfatase activity